jgi:ribonuclease E
VPSSAATSAGTASDEEPEEDAGGPDRGEPAEAEGGEDGKARKRRRGRRGGRRSRRGHGGEERDEAFENGQGEDFDPATLAARSYDDVFADPYEIDTTPTMEPKPRPEPDEATRDEKGESPAPPLAEEERIGPVAFEPPRTPERPEEREPVGSAVSDDARTTPQETEEERNRPKRSGWWQRRSFF